MLEEISSNEKYRYPSIDALNTSLAATYQKAIDARKAVEELTAGKTIEESSGHTIGAFTSNWWSAFVSNFGAVEAHQHMANYDDLYSFGDARQDDTRDAIVAIARRDSQSRVNSAYADLGRARTDIEIGAFISNIKGRFGQDEGKLKRSLWHAGRDGNVIYTKGVGGVRCLSALRLC